MAVIYVGRKEEGVVMHVCSTHILLPFTPYVPRQHGTETAMVEDLIVRAAKTEAGMPRCNPERKADLALVQKYDPSRHDWQIRDYIEEMGVRAKDLDLAFAAHREAAIAQERQNVPCKKDILAASIAELMAWLKREKAIDEAENPKNWWGRRQELREKCYIVFGHKVETPDEEARPEANPIPRQAKDVEAD